MPKILKFKQIAVYCKLVSYGAAKSVIRSFVRSVVRSFGRSLVRSLVHPFIHQKISFNCLVPLPQAGDRATAQS